jgi:hypothetical protein
MGKNINSIENDPKIILNGPLNYIELYNDKTNQKLHLFMDNHQNITKQKKCEEYEAKDIDKYLYKVLSETSEVLDFFLEINPTDIINENKYHSNDNYILETRKIFRKIYKEQQLNKYCNVRLHYMDIRDYSFYNELVRIIINVVNEIEQYQLSNITYIIDEIKYISSRLIFINSCIDKIKNNENINIDKFDIINFKIISNTNNNQDNNKNNIEKKNIGFQQLLLKILTKYSNQDDKNNIINFFENNYLIQSKEAINIIKEVLINLEQIQKIFEHQSQNNKLNIDKIIINEKKNIILNTTYYGINHPDYIKFSRLIYDELSKLEFFLVRLGTIFMDSFFLRRLIEKKKYIKNSIIYTGGFHTIVYVWFLIKYYDFKISNYYYLNTEKIGIYDDNINNINIKIKNIINNSTNVNDLLEIFMPIKFNQCVKIKKIN